MLGVAAVGYGPSSFSSFSIFLTILGRPPVGNPNPSNMDPGARQAAHFRNMRCVVYNPLPSEEGTTLKVQRILTLKLRPNYDFEARTWL